jgi:hypothetical protein
MESLGSGRRAGVHVEGRVCSRRRGCSSGVTGADVPAKLVLGAFVAAWFAKMDGGCDGGIDLRCRGDVRHKTISAAPTLARVRNSGRASCSIHARRPYCRRHSLTSGGSQFRFHGDGARQSARHEHQWSQ